MVIVSRKFKPPSIDNSHRFLSLFGIHTFGNIFWQDSLNEIQNKHKNKLKWQSHFFMFRRLQNNVTWFLYMQHFYVWHQPEIWSKVIAILSSKSSQKKNKHSKWKTCLVKNIIAAKSINYLLMKNSVSPHFLWFFKTLNSLINRGGRWWGGGGGGGGVERAPSSHTVNGVQMT